MTGLSERVQFPLKPQILTHSHPILVRCIWINVQFSARFWQVLSWSLGSPTGCISLPSKYSLGIRPDPTPYGCPNAGLIGHFVSYEWANFASYYDWSKRLEEAYLSRATFNEWAIYVGGTIALATVSTSAALAALHAATETLTLLPIAGGFSSGFLALLDNKSLASSYTEAANAIRSGRKTAITSVGVAEGSYLQSSMTGDATAQKALGQASREAYSIFNEKVSEATTTLENSRKTLGGTAEARLTAELAKANQRIAKLEEESAQKGDLTIAVGNNRPELPQDVIYDLTNQRADITFKAPGLPSPLNPEGYDVTLRLRNLSIRSLPNLRLKYKSA